MRPTSTSHSVDVGTEPGRAPGRGRPRDPDLEQRALRVAVELFAEKGWTGVTLDRVSSRARIGKSALYLRWSGREQLLAAALRHIQEPEKRAAGMSEEEAPADGVARPTLRDYLIQHAMQRAQLYLGEYGMAMMRLYVEAAAHPEVLAEVRREALTRYVLTERARVAAAVESGELAPDASPMRILDAVEGAVLMHVIVTPPHLMERVRQGIGEYVEQMVDDQLRAAGYREAAVSGPQVASSGS